MEEINPRLCQHDLGGAFQIFVHEVLLPDYPDLHLFPSMGKDGAIDLSQTMAVSRTIFECKYISEGGLEECQSVWRNVAHNLEKHLADSSGPTKGQAQYRPWYRTDPPIREYIFCTSSILSNQNQIDQLKQEIEFFTDLSSKHEHLRHLKELSVEVYDWNALCSRLKQHPNLIFRWFHLTRPQGLVPLDDSPDRGTFRSYLSSEKLAYYSIGQHLKVMPAPPGVAIPEEEKLLSFLKEGDTTGLVVTGDGGVGKTRMMLEIGRLAQRKAWLVLRVQSRLREDALERLAERITPNTPVLLLVDYIETHKDFSELVETLNVLNDTYYLRLRYVASCRTSFYQTIAAISRHKQVDLSPAVQDSTISWFEGYQKQTVRHILEQSGLEITERHLAICRDKPILAVLVSYLHSMGRQPDLTELLKEVDFGTWVAKRVQLSFGQTVINRDLAQLMALFPMPFDVTFNLDKEKQMFLFDTLAADGWIEELPADEFHDVEWVMAHDVLADQILLSYFRSIPPTCELFTNELLFQGSKTGCLHSVLLTLQRLIDQPELSSLNWSNILARNISGDLGAWREVRDILIRTSLLTPLEIIVLLGMHGELWKDVEGELYFQNALGWLTRWAVNQKEPCLDSANRTTLDSWIQKASNYTTRSNFILTWGLRFSTEATRGPALEWISKRPALFQTHYLLVAWMECHLPLEDIALSVQQWIDKFKYEFHLSFVSEAWLNAGGDEELVREPIKTWLEKHKADAEAHFVYKAWLDAKGELELVREPIKAWLEKHKADAEARFVYQSWLDANGELELVRESIKTWHEKHEADAEASFVYQSWLEAKGELEMVREPIKTWLENHKADAEAGFVYKAWLDTKGELVLVREPIKTWLEKHKADYESHFVYKAWLDAKGELELVREPIKAWLENNWEADKADFVYKAWLDAGGAFSVVSSHAILWLHQNCDKEEAVYLTKFLAKQSDIPVETVKDILMWCQRFPNNEETIWRLTQLKVHLLNEEIGEEVITTSEAVLNPLILTHGPLKAVIRGLIATLFSYLINAPKLRSGQLRNHVDKLFLSWLRNPESFGSDPKPYINLQRLDYVQRVIDIIVSGSLDIIADYEHIERFLHWVNCWELERKSQLYRKFDFLKHNYPEPGLWDIVKIR